MRTCEKLIIGAKPSSGDSSAPSVENEKQSRIGRFERSMWIRWSVRLTAYSHVWLTVFFAYASVFFLYIFQGLAVEKG